MLSIRHINHIIEWKSIFRYCKALDTDLSLALLHHNDNRIIFSPSNHFYNGELTFGVRMQITGLYDTLWSNKTSDQKSVLVCKSIKISPYYSSEESIMIKVLI